MSENNVKTESSILSIKSIFNDFLKPGKIVRKKEILPGLTIKVTPIGVGKLAISQNVATGLNDATSAKVSACRVLSEAISEINDEVIFAETEEELAKIRSALYATLFEMPPFVIQLMYEFYLSVEKEQESILRNPNDLQKSIENF